MNDDYRHYPPKHPPAPGRIIRVVVRRKGHRIMPTATVQLAPTNPLDHVTSRLVSFTLNGTLLAAVEAVNAPASFAVNVGDTYSVNEVDSNSVGSAGVSNTLTGTITLPATVPAPGVITAVIVTP
jgi:hypothetical protein